MASEYVIKGLVLDAPSFVNSFKRLPEGIKKEARRLIGEMVMQERMPAKLHFHKLSGHDNIWTIHISSNDTYKASLTIKDGIAHFRKAGVHDEIDKHP